MSIEQNKRVVERFYEHLRAGTIGAATDIVTPDCVRHDPSGHQEPGPSGFAARVKRTDAAFTDLNSVPDIVMAEGDKVAVRWTITGRHTGPYRGFPQGCSTLSIEFPVEERIGSGESGSISILTEC